MDGYEWIAEAAAEERDAIARALAEDRAEASRGGRGFVRAERRTDLAKELFKKGSKAKWNVTTSTLVEPFESMKKVREPRTPGYERHSAQKSNRSRGACKCTPRVRAAAASQRGLTLERAADRMARSRWAPRPSPTRSYGLTSNLMTSTRGGRS